MATDLATDLLEGVGEKSSKSELLERLNRAADLVRAQTRQRTGRLAEIEARVRTKYKPGDTPVLHQAIISATEDEWRAAKEFLEEWGDLLPAALHRILLGGQELLGKDKAV